MANALCLIRQMAVNSSPRGILSTFPLRTTSFPQIWNNFSIRLMFFSTNNPSDHYEDTVREFSMILKRKDWVILLNNEDSLRKLNPEVVCSVLQKSEIDDSVRLQNFFYWSSSKMSTPQNLLSYSILAIRLCNSGLIHQAQNMLEKLLETRKPPLEILDSLDVRFFE
uniref:Pentatricopeptide repeat-containing protein n=1 Tax=Cucumis melo TaxID=3656 RepID=A0A9I9D266_CUCME